MNFAQNIGNVRYTFGSLRELLARGLLCAALSDAKSLPAEGSTNGGQS